MPAAVRTYFAARSSEEIGRALCGRLERLLKVEGEDVHDSRDKWATAYRHYYGEEMGWGVSYAVSRTGEQGELAAVRINRARAYAKALQALVTATKPAWRPQARNSDAGAAAATSIASSILADFWNERGLDRMFLRWVEMAIAFGRAHVFAPWDTSMGPPLAPKEGRMKMQGDVALHVLPPWDVWVDPSLKSWDAANWHFAVVYKNRFDLAKQYDVLADGRAGEKAEEAILTADSSEELDPSRRCRDAETELVPVWHFFHKPTPSLPAGRQVVFLNGNVVLVDKKLTATYDEVPIYSLFADEKLDTAEAWTNFWDTLGAQELQDGIETTLATILTTLGNPCIGIQKGSEMNPTILASGFRAWPYPPGGNPPEAIQLAEFPPDALKYKEQISADQRQLMGLNDVALGQPQSAQMNAQAFAVLAAMAVQQASPFQTAAFGGLGALGGGILKTLGKNVSKERELKVTGKSSESLYAVQKYSGSQLSPIDGVTVKIGNPMEQTPAGKMQMLEVLRQVPGAIQTAEQVYQVMETGRLEPVLRAARDEQNLIQAEYELLQQGIAPVVHTLQNHQLHYRENAAVLANPDVLRNPDVVAVVQQHLDEHYLEYFGVPPGGDAAAGIPPDPLRLPRQRFLLAQGPEPMPMPPPGMPGDPNATGAPAAGDGSAAPPPISGDASQAPPPALGGPVSPELPVDQPTMPPNPLTGQPFDAATGGGMAIQ